MLLKSLIKLYSSLLFGAVLLTSCTNQSGNDAKAASTPKDTMSSIEAFSILKKRPFYVISLPGEVKPYEEVKLYAKLKSFVKKLYVDRGSAVRKGQLLAVLEAPEINQEFLSSKSTEQKLYSNYQYSKQAYERLLKAADKEGAVAYIELDKAKNQVESDSAAYTAATANAQAARQLNNYLHIIAPFDGTITARNVSEGALVGEGGALPLFHLAQNNRLRLEVAVPEKHIRSLDRNTQISFAVSQHPSKIFQAKWSRDSKVLTNRARAVNVEFDIDNSESELSGGEYAAVNMQLQRRDSTWWVPETSIVQNQLGIFVLKVNQDHTLSRIPVTLGNQEDDQIEIFGNLSHQNKIVKIASEELPLKKKINIK